MANGKDKTYYEIESEEKTMGKEQAIKYLENVLKVWKAFCDEHSNFAKAINILLEEVKGE